MKSYLGLVSEYEKAHKKKNRLTIVCIAVSVMLVTAIFSMADMSIKAQINEYIRQHGNFHAIISGISDETAEQIGSRNDVKVSDWFGMAEDTKFLGKDLIVQGCGQELAEQMSLVVTEGTYPLLAQEALIDRLALEQFGISIGDMIDIQFSDGQPRQYKIVGTYNDFSSLKGTDAHGLQLSAEGIRALPSATYQKYFYIQFKAGVNINKTLSVIKAEYGISNEQISTNIILLGLMGQSDNSAMIELYLTAGILFILVAMAGVFMIASSFNMSVLERTQFFGLLRCLGATKKQVKRYIRLEGFRYCAKGIPIGLLAGCILIWIASLFLNALNSQFLPEMPLFQISLPGIAAGMAIGLLVVMIASRSPAKKAAKVSPQAAVTGNVNNTDNQQIVKPSNTKRFHVDIAMGLSHAFSNKKSMRLIAGSFAISIILFLCFTVFITFMNHALNPLKPYAPDISIMSEDNSALIDRSIMEKVKTLPHKNIYARMFYNDIPASDEQGNGTAILISYDEPQFAWAKDALITGTIDNVKSGGGVLVSYGYAEEYNWCIGDTITLNIEGKPHNVHISGILSDVPFAAENGEWTIICSEATFTALTGISDYTIIDLQLNEDISAKIRNLIPQEMQILDKQQRNNETRMTYYAMAVFVYGFLIVIALVALINIINTVNASVASRINNYGVMRAVGMSGKQLKRMVTAEAAAYAITGSVVGGILGLFLHRFFFGIMVTSNWGELWQPPLLVLAITILAAILTTFVAVIPPTNKIEKMSIVNVVNAQ